MGAAVWSKCSTKHDEEEFMRARIHVLEREVRELASAREREAREYEQHLVLLAVEEERRKKTERVRRRDTDGKDCEWEYYQARRDIAVEKWKQLYLDIKMELDDLIQMTREGGRFCWEAEEGIIEGLRREMKMKEEVMEALRSRIAALEKEAKNREREIDILRQSLRILSNTKRNRRRNQPRGTLRL